MSENNELRKILVLLSSPRKKGNSATLANEIIRGAESEGANVETVRLHGMDISPCQACYACQKKDSKGCAIDDEMQTIYPKLLKHDTWVIASPVYWFTMSAKPNYLWTDVLRFIVMRKNHLKRHLPTNGLALQ
jgi:multimeric flavodoxin WrbA